MSRLRTGLGWGVIAALVVGVWAAVASGDDDGGATSTTVFETVTTGAPVTAAESSTTSSASTSTSVPSTPPTSQPTTTLDPEARTEEVRIILEDLYFRWFEAIYHEDEEAVMDVVATEVYLDSFRDAVTNLELARSPRRSEVVVRDVEVLRDDAKCLVTFSTLDLTAWRGKGVTTSGVDVLLRVDGDWRFGTSWTNRDDLWEGDCKISPELAS